MKMSYFLLLQTLPLNDLVLPNFMIFLYMNNVGLQLN